MMRNTLFAVVAAALLAGPWLIDPGLQRLLIEMLVVLTLAQLWNLLAGYAGLLSFGQHAFVGIGAYALYQFTPLREWHPVAWVPLVALLCGVLAGLVAPLLFRLREAYFAIGMWVFAECVRLGVSQWDQLGRTQGLALTLPETVDVEAYVSSLYLATVLLSLGTLAGLVALLRSRFGLGLMAVRDHEEAAAGVGVSVRACRWWAFVLAAALTGAAGALYFGAVLYVDPGAAFDTDWLVKMLFIVVVGGMSTLEGPIVGTLLYFALREAFSAWGGLYLIGMGAFAVATMLFAPRGLWGLVQERWGWSLFPLQRTAPTNSLRGILNLADVPSAQRFVVTELRDGEHRPASQE